MYSDVDSIIGPMVQKKLVVAKGKEMDVLAGQGGDGVWQELWGQEVIHREILPRVKPGDKVLDLGGHVGRVSLPLAAIIKARVIIVDQNEEAMKHGWELREKAGMRVNIKRIVADVRGLRKKDMGGGASVVLASDVLNHMSKEDADTLIDNLPGLLNRRRGGMVYVNVPSTETGIFQYPEYHGARRVDERTIELSCDCSGELKDELMRRNIKIGMFFA